VVDCNFSRSCPEFAETLQHTPRNEVAIRVTLFDGIRHGDRFYFSSTTERNERSMLRITRSDQNGTDPSVKLEGKLLKPWVDEVRRLFTASESTPLPRLELAGLTFVDAAGADLLRQLLRRGVQVKSCSAYVAEVLHRAGNKPIEGVFCGN
jgi:hypothetical protein